ncbi:hypothetical protein EG68_09781 [Paragonimus skrjabini miyazakii]|uniref:Uncharacterized protein n=1 Tax=Paragonimus skrjabini miyazakii TaxID=59628 RepID=A0A8S9YIV0_9TREM|nr:hypothetical protein EG68_09781 [Paragonimus skrjabini miyazakii]
MGRKAGSDGIHLSTFKPVANVLVRSLARLFTMSLEEDGLHGKWELAAMAPIHGGEAKEVVSKYRPVNLKSGMLEVLGRKVGDKVV